MAGRKRSPVAGWTRLSAGRYRSPDGEEVSRRQYDNARLRALGFSSRSERERLAKQNESRLNYFARLIARQEGRTIREVKRDPAFVKASSSAMRSGMRGSPKSGAARILVRAGLRAPDAPDRVGEGYERKRRKAPRQR